MGWVHHVSRGTNARLHKRDKRDANTTGVSPLGALSGATSRPALLRVQRLDLVLVLLGDRLALELHGRRELLPARLPVGREELELLDLLHAGQVLVGAVHALLDGLDHGVLAREVLDRLALEAVLAGETGGRVRVERDQRGVERPPVADGD